MERVLIHACCGADALYFIRRFREEHPDDSLVCFFYDPNIHPPEEYRLRMIETLRVCRELGIEFVEGEYDPERWLRAVRGLENEPERGRRCDLCFDLRLERSAELARDLGCTALTTTLLMSPKKDHRQLLNSGRRAAERYGLRFLAVDYRKGGGVQEMFRSAREKDIYLQDYCGCIYGFLNQGKEPIASWGRRPGSTEETLFIKEIRLLAETLGLKVREEEFPFLNWRVLEGGIWVRGGSVPSIVVPYSSSTRGRVRADVKKVAGSTLYLNKQFIRIVLLEELKDSLLKEARILTEPTFLVHRSWESTLKENRVEVYLKTELRTDVSRWLLIGDPAAEHLTGIPADTLQDHRGISFGEISSLIRQEVTALKEGKLALVLLGAFSLGRAGEKHFEEHTGRKPDTLLSY